LYPETGRVDTESLFGERNWKVVKPFKGTLLLNETIVVPGISKANYDSFVQTVVPTLTKFITSFERKKSQADCETTHAPSCEKPWSVQKQVLARKPYEGM